MRRFTIGPEGLQGDRVVFDGQESHHMRVVLRLAPGDLVIAGDGRGRDYTVRLERLGEAAEGTVLAVVPTTAESPLAVTLLQAVPRGDRMELIVRAATELGVARIQPVITERTVVRLDPARGRERARRWQRVAREAAKQCGRAVVPEVESPRPLPECLAGDGEPGLALCLWEGAAAGLADVVAGLTSLARARLLIGPEGGLARGEVEQALALGWRTAWLGPRLLRSETAGPAVLAILQSRFGDIGRWGAPSGPPIPPDARGVPAEPGRPSIPPDPRGVPAEPGRPSTP